MSDITSNDIALLVRVISKIEEGFLDRLDQEEAKVFKQLQGISDTLLTDTEKARAKGTKPPNRTAYEAALKRASEMLKTVSARPKPTKDAEPKPGKVEWEVVNFVDEGNCESAAKACGGKVESGYKRDKKKYMERDITEGDLGVLYETNLTTQGDKYSLFFKYVRTGEGKANMVAVAIGSHSGSGSKYFVVKKDGGSSTNQISATKKL